MPVAVCSFAGGNSEYSKSPEIPIDIVQEFQSRGCRVPHPKTTIHGEFFVAGRTDWAAVCAAKMSASLLVFPGGSRERVAVLETQPKGFSKWSIGVVNESQLRQTWPWEEPQAAEINHQAIFSFVEFGQRGACLYCYSAQGRTYYYHRDRWLTPATTAIN